MEPQAQQATPTPLPVQGNGRNYALDFTTYMYWKRRRHVFARSGILSLQGKMLTLTGNSQQIFSLPASQLRIRMNRNFFWVTTPTGDFILSYFGPGLSRKDRHQIRQDDENAQASPQSMLVISDRDYGNEGPFNIWMKVFDAHGISYEHIPNSRLLIGIAFFFVLALIPIVLFFLWLQFLVPVTNP